MSFLDRLNILRHVDKCVGKLFYILYDGCMGGWIKVLGVDIMFLEKWKDGCTS